MGKNNRARRAAKAKHRAKHDDRRRARYDRTEHPHTDEPPLTTEELVAFLLEVASHLPHGDEQFAAEALDRLYDCDHALVSREAEHQALLLLRAIWAHGWQPVELVRQVRRTTSVSVARLALAMIAADHADRAAATVDPRWVAQLDRIHLPRVGSAGWLLEWVAREQLSWRDAIGAVVGLLRCLAAVWPIPILIPPPGTRSASDPVDLTATTNDPILDRVRALLAQAESTPFEAEAETFTAKAQELMTRHAIDVAMLSTSSHRSESPLTIRIPIDDPYLHAKSLLLQYVAAHSRCRSVFHPDFAMSSIVGFAGDVTATEMLFTSLLVQAQAAMGSAAAAAPAGARARSRSFRSAFLVAYAKRISERLAEINAGVVDRAEAETNRSIVPVLAARSTVVDAATAELFGELEHSAVRGADDLAGWTSGHLAADRARLNLADLTTAEPPVSARSALPAPRG